MLFHNFLVEYTAAEEVEEPSIIIAYNMQPPSYSERGNGPPTFECLAIFGIVELKTKLKLHAQRAIVNIATDTYCGE